MATARDKLVSDWRQQLHAAQDQLAGSPHHAWLARMRVRLFRFLLSCYGKSPWTTTPPARRKKPTPHVADAPSAVVFDAPDAELLRGKPAKPAGKIRSVLKAVAGAQQYIPQPGRLCRELVVGLPLESSSGRKGA